MSRALGFVLMLAWVGGIVQAGGGGKYVAALDPTDSSTYVLNDDRIQKRNGSIVLKERALEASTINGAVVSSDGLLILAEDSMDSGRVRILTPDLTEHTSIELGHRPLAIGAAEGTLAVLWTALRDGWSLTVFDDSFEEVSTFAVDFAECPIHDIPETVDVEVEGRDRIYVAHLACNGEYRIRRYDSDGNIRQEIATHADESSRPSGRSISPAANDMFLMDAQIGMVLNERVGADGATVEIWSPDGINQGSVALTGVPTSIVSVLRRSDGEWVALERLTGAFKNIHLPVSAEGGQR